MYRILIVDDEPYIVDWISELLEQDAEQEFDIYRAYSAFDALQWMERAKIDIMISDISMPGMSGLTLLEKVRENWSGCKVILLTAYSNFDFAYEAMKNNIEAYILKTEDDDRILYEVRKIIKKMDEEHRAYELLDEARNTIGKYATAIQKEYLQELLMGKFYTTEELATQFDRLGILLSPTTPVFILAGRIENPPVNMPITERFYYMNSIEKIVEKALSMFIVSVPVEYERTKLIWLIQPRNCDANESNGVFDNMKKVIMNMLEDVQISCKKALNINMTYILANIPVHYEGLADRFQSLNQLFYFYAANENNVVATDQALRDALDQSMIRSHVEVGEVRRKLNLVESLKNYLESGQKKEFAGGLYKVCQVLRSAKSWHDNIALEIYYSVALMLVAYINQKDLTGKIAFKIGLNKLMRVDMHNSWNDAADYFCQLSEIIFDIQKEDQDYLLTSLVKFIREYIENNIADDVSLVRISEVTGYNPSYLSRLYKSITGENLIDYTGKVRIERAKRLLETEDINISDIAVKAGFESRTYFNKFFKKMTGTTPNEYRQSFILGRQSGIS